MRMRRALALPIAVVASVARVLEQLGCWTSEPSRTDPDTDGDGLSGSEISAVPLDAEGSPSGTTHAGTEPLAGTGPAADGGLQVMGP
jgi:hypothetical protein